MTIIIIASLILLGILFLLAEIFVFPGVSVAGIGGGVLLLIGIFLAYTKLGSTGGHITLALTLIVSIVLFVMALRSNSWKKMSLETTVDGKVETVDKALINVGDKGVAVSRINPIGRGVFNHHIVEVKCPGQFVDEQTPLEVVQVHETYIIVKPIN